MAEIPLVAHIEETFSKPEDLLVVLLLDSSGSVASQYEDLRTLALILIQKMPNIMVQIMQFSSIVEVVCPFTTNSSTLEKCVRGMKHLNSGTNMKDAFREVRTTFFRTVTEDSRPVVFFITDGDYSGQSPESEIQELLKIQPFPQIYGIGVGGGINKERLQQLLPNQPVFMSNNYAELANVLKSLTVKSPVKVDPCIKIWFEPGQKGLQPSKSDLEISVCIEPDDPLTFLAKGTTIKFLSNNFFFGEKLETNEEVKKYEPKKFNVKLQIKPQAKLFGEFPEKIYFEATIPNAKRGTFKGSVEMQLAWLSADFFYKWPVNILLWGSWGSGKSSFINGILNLFRAAPDFKKLLMTFKSEGHVTTKYQMIDIANELLIDSSDDLGLGNNLKPDVHVQELVSQHLKLRIFDPWGVNAENYHKLSVCEFIEGKIAPDTQMFDQKVISTKPNPLYAIHAVIFIIPIGIAQDENLLKILEKHVKDLLTIGIKPVIVVNWVKTIKSEDEIAANFQKILNASHLEKSDLFLHDNYVEETNRNMMTDLSYCKILRTAFKRAVEIVRRNPDYQISAPIPKATSNLRNMNIELVVIFNNERMEVSVKAESTLKDFLLETLEGLGEDPSMVNKISIIRKKDKKKLQLHEVVNNVLTANEELIFTKEIPLSSPTVGLHKVQIVFENDPIEIQIKPSATIKELVMLVIEGLGEDPATATSFILTKQNKNRLLFNQIVGDVIPVGEVVNLDRKK